MIHFPSHRLSRPLPPLLQPALINGGLSECVGVRVHNVAVLLKVSFVNLAGMVDFSVGKINIIILNIDQMD